MGSLYKRGNTWWAKYYLDGRPIRRSCKTPKETEARKLLRHWEGNPRTTLPVQDRLTVDAMLAAVVADQEAQGRRSVAKTRTTWTPSRGTSGAGGLSPSVGRTWTPSSPSERGPRPPGAMG